MWSHFGSDWLVSGCDRTELGVPQQGIATPLFSVRPSAGTSRSSTAIGRPLLPMTLRRNSVPKFSELSRAEQLLCGCVHPIAPQPIFPAVQRSEKFQASFNHTSSFLFLSCLG
ncbi:hypothetical protein VTK26DRAFT_2619 [Humicola hyalothermophila]